MKVYDKDGVELTDNAISLFTSRQIEKIRYKNNKRLAEQITSYCNKVIEENAEFVLSDAYLVISVVRNHNQTDSL